ncbi:hypothetical protein BD289DRAFT_87734 [Coniella lustricola]|uniref:Uncharacterized protein n=1 Tax=Coniella lustricola TaxID=2025994 RepID=A0A2T2ZYR9_9PEZI|nr:hypothetical protein BD289DRAFT_87734 [Coniella lustricola]
MLVQSVSKTPDNSPETHRRVYRKTARSQRRSELSLCLVGVRSKPQASPKGLFSNRTSTQSGTSTATPQQRLNNKGPR